MLKFKVTVRCTYMFVWDLFSTKVAVRCTCLSELQQNLWCFAPGWAVFSPFQHLHKQPAKVGFSKDNDMRSLKLSKKSKIRKPELITKSLSCFSFQIGR